MMILIIREFLMDLNKMFRGWRLVIHLSLLGLVIIMSRTDGAAEVGHMIMTYSILSTAFMKPKLNKLFYLLPTRTQDRINYVLFKCFGLFLYNILLYFAAVTVAILLTDYRFSQELPTLICNVMPVLIAYCSLCMGNGYNLGKSQNEVLTKRYQNQYAVSIFLAIPTMLIAFFFDISVFDVWIQGPFMIIITLLAYIFAISCMCSQLAVLKHTELSEENIRKVEKLFG